MALFLRLQPLVYGSALSLAALACKSSDTVPSNSPNPHRAPTSQSAEESGVNSETSAPLPQSAVTPPKPEETVSANQPSPKQGSSDKQKSLDDAEIVAIADAANSAEVEQGRLAREKAKDPRVRDFAAMMVDHHGEALRDQQTLSVEPSQSAESNRMQQEAQDALKALKAKSGKDFDRAYLQLQIDEHQEVLRTLEDKLLPSVKDAKLEAYLKKIKPTIESHLAQAQRLQEELNGTSSLNEHPQSATPARGSSARLSGH